MTWLKKRLLEPSTWAGIGGVVTASAVVTPPYSWIAIVCGVVALLLAEGSDGQRS